MFLTITSFIIILGLFIFAHEMGHFLVARIMGVKAEEFGFGFPPRIIGIVFNNKRKKWELIRGNKSKKRKNTIYSLNWIPLGGFVKILGEDGEKKDQVGKKDPQSFTAKPVWQRILILASGVAMNFLLAVLIFSFGFYVGLPEAVSGAGKNLKNAKVQIVEITPDSPAASMELKPGDEIISLTSPEETVTIGEVSDVVSFLEKNRGEEILMEVRRGDDIYRARGVPRPNPPPNEGSLGIALTKTAIVSYPLLTSVKMGFTTACDVTGAIIKALGRMLGDLILKGRTQADVAGPVGIVVLTNQAAEMGFAYLLQFAAVLSINLAIINILPLPALDGGRILFLIVEKIKKSPVSSEVEKRIHLAGFYLLVTLMIVVTVRDVFKFQDKFQVLWEKITNIL